MFNIITDDYSLNKIRIRSKIFTSVSALVLISAIVNPASAQENPAPQDGNSLNSDIVVTAQRKLQTILDVPVSATVFSADKIDAAHYEDAKDYLLQTPNVSFQQGGNNGAREIVISIRGISDLKNGEKVVTQSAFATYIDEFSAGMLASGQANPDIYDVDAVEVLRGPQGVFFGRNSEGGAINIRSRKPTEDFYGRVDFGVGRFSTYELGAVINGKITDGLSARLTVHGTSTQGPIRNLGSGGGGSDAQYVNVRGQLRWQPTTTSTLDLEVNHTIDNSGIQPKLGSCINQSAFGLPYNLASPQLLGGIGCYDPNGAFSNFVKANPNDPSLGGLPRSAFPNNTRYVYQDTPDHTNNESTLVIAKAYSELGSNVAVTAVAGYSESKQDQFLDLDRSGIKAINRLGLFSTYSYSFESRLSSIGDHNAVDWTVGGIAYREQLRSVNQILIEQVLGPWVPGDKANENRIANQLSGWALFGNAEWHITDALSLIVGGRYSFDKGINSWSDVYAACGSRHVGDPLDTSTIADGNGPCQLSPEQALMNARGQLPIYGGLITGGRYEQLTGRYAENSGHDFSPRIAVNWKPNGDTSLYGSVSKGYKPAGGIANPDSGLGGASRFGREQLWNYEVGGNAYLLNRRLLLQGALFYMDWKDFQFQTLQTLCVLRSTGALVPVVPSLDLSTCSRQLEANSIVNLPRARSEGAEFSATARVTNSLTVSGSVGYLDAKYVRGTANISGAPMDLSGMRIGNSPRWTASANIDQAFDLAGGKATIGLNWSYRGTSSLNVVEQVTQTFPTQVDAISLFNLRLSQSWGKNRVTATVDNLLNRAYYTAAVGFSFVGPQLTYNPRTWSIRWTSEF